MRIFSIYLGNLPFTAHGQKPKNTEEDKIKAEKQSKQNTLTTNNQMNAQEPMAHFIFQLRMRRISFHFIFPFCFMLSSFFYTLLFLHFSSVRVETEYFKLTKMFITHHLS